MKNVRFPKKCPLMGYLIPMSIIWCLWRRVHYTIIDIIFLPICMMSQWKHPLVFLITRKQFFNALWIEETRYWKIFQSSIELEHFSLDFLQSLRLIPFFLWVYPNSYLQNSICHLDARAFPRSYLNLPLTHQSHHTELTMKWHSRVSQTPTLLHSYLLQVREWVWPVLFWMDYS